MADAPRPYLPAVYLLAIFLPLGIAPAEIALGAGLLIWAGTLVRRGWNRSPVDAPLLAFFLAGLASAAASADPAGSARAAISCWTLLTFFLAREAASDLRTVRRLLLVLSIAGTVAAAVGIVAGLLGGQGPVDGLLTWLGVPSPARFGGRVSGFFSHPMTFAGQQAMLLVVCATLAGGRLRSPSEDDAGEPAWRGGLRFVLLR